MPNLYRYPCRYRYAKPNAEYARDTRLCVAIGLLVNEIVQGRQRLFESPLIDLNTVSRHLIISDLDRPACARAAPIPTLGDAPTSPRLFKGWTRVSNLYTFAQHCQGVEDVEKDAMATISDNTRLGQGHTWRTLV